MGVDLAKLPLEEEMRKALQKKLQENSSCALSKLNALVILLEGTPIGVHTLFPFTEGDSGIFHAHIWQPEVRHKGLGMQSYPLACRTFMQRFSLRRIVFKTPVQNKGALRVKEKLGIRCIGEEEIGFSIIKAGTLAKVYELTQSEVDLLLKA